MDHDDALTAQLALLSISKPYINKLRIIAEQNLEFHDANLDPTALIGAILLVEMHQRPGPVRAAEWVASTLVPKALRRPITRGPLQIADGPWKLRDAVAIAASVLAPAVRDVTSKSAAIYSAAARWNGAATQQPGSSYGYGDVLRESYEVAQRAITRLHPRP